MKHWSSRGEKDYKSQTSNITELYESVSLQNGDGWMKLTFPNVALYIVCIVMVSTFWKNKEQCLQTRHIQTTHSQVTTIHNHVHLSSLPVLTQPMGQNVWLNCESWNVTWYVTGHIWPTICGCSAISCVDSHVSCPQLSCPRIPWQDSYF